MNEQASIEPIASLDREITSVEEQLSGMKEQRSSLVQDAVGSGVTMYAIAQACKRSPSTVQRWVR